MKALKKCVGCGEHFIPNCNAQKYCTRRCRLKIYKKSVSAAYNIILKLLNSLFLYQNTM